MITFIKNNKLLDLVQKKLYMHLFISYFGKIFKLIYFFFVYLKVLIIVFSYSRENKHLRDIVMMSQMMRVWLGRGTEGREDGKGWAAVNTLLILNRLTISSFSRKFFYNYFLFLNVQFESLLKFYIMPKQ